MRGHGRGQGEGGLPQNVYICIRSHLPPIAQEGEEMVRGPRFELGTPRFSAGCLKRRRGHKSLRHNVGSSTHSCKSFTALHRVARGNVYGIRIGGRGAELPRASCSRPSACRNAPPSIWKCSTAPGFVPASRTIRAISPGATRASRRRRCLSIFRKTR